MPEWAADLPAHPILTPQAVANLYGVSASVARKALYSLEEAGIVRSKVIGKHGRTGLYADEIIDLISTADRQLASSQFDTRLAPPSARAVPEF